MRNALIVLAVAALALLVAAAFNTGVAVDLDYVVGTWEGVSLTWILLIAAGLLFVAGAVGALLARAGCGEARRKLEKELESTYRRLREAQAAAPSSGAAPAALDDEPTAVAALPEEPTAVSTAADAAEAPTAAVTAGEAQPLTAAEEAPTLVADSGLPAAGSPEATAGDETPAEAGGAAGAADDDPAEPAPRS